MPQISLKPRFISRAKAAASNAQTLAIVFLAVLILPLSAEACPMGMQEHGDDCIVPSYSADDWIREQYEYIDSLGPKNPAPVRFLSPEEWEEMRVLEAEKAERDLKRDQELAHGVWFSDASPTREDKLCVATFAKMTRADNGKSGGMVSIFGFQDPAKPAWLIFYGPALPKPKKVKKITVSLQQDNAPAQDVQAVNYRNKSDLGVVAFSGNNLAVALNGMHDTQSFKLSLGGKSVMAIQWTDAAPMIERLRQCAQ